MSINKTIKENLSISYIRDVGGNYPNRKTEEKRLLWLIILVFVIVLGVFLYTF